jgi:hypothetical protein
MLLANTAHHTFLVVFPRPPFPLSVSAFLVLLALLFFDLLLAFEKQQRSERFAIIVSLPVVEADTLHNKHNSHAHNKHK